MSRTPLTDGICAACGRETEGYAEYRSYCSPACQTDASRYPSGRPTGRECFLCGGWIDLTAHRPGGRRVRSNTRKCFDCRRDQRYALTVEQLIGRDGEACALCGEQVDPSLKWPDRMCGTRDHVMPVTLGGTNEASNLQLAHLSCNSRKGNRATVRAA